jgi:hypothetical protein
MKVKLYKVNTLSLYSGAKDKVIKGIEFVTTLEG